MRIFIGLTVFTIALAGCSDERVRSTVAVNDAGGASAQSGDLVGASEPQIKAFCGRCHAFPAPEIGPREAWTREVEECFKFNRESAFADLPAPEKELVLEYFLQRAPLAADIQPPPKEGSGDAGGLRFTKHVIAAGGLPREPTVSELAWTALSPSSPAVLVACDMRTGRVGPLDPLAAAESEAWAILKHPCHIAACDLNGDGQGDMLAADLGTFKASDDRQGRVVWLRGTAWGTFDAVELATGLGRVAAAKPGDFDGDQDIDIIVAEFGWRKEGRIFLMTNRGLKDGKPEFDSTSIDSRHGTSDVLPADLNGDGKLDFVALISQEFESVEAFINRGDGTFDARKLFAADNPAYGSSAIQLADLDNDGDLDVLFANGDGFDRGHLKPFHSLQWLENEGEFPFEHHHLTWIPGCHQAVAGDLDLDGDLDIAAAAFLHTATQALLPPHVFDGVIWMEQTAKGQFVRHSLEVGAADHCVLELADLDGDRDLDMVVGNFAFRETGGRTDLPPATVWWNELRTPAGNGNTLKPPSQRIRNAGG